MNWDEQMQQAIENQTRSIDRKIAMLDLEAHSHAAMLDGLNPEQLKSVCTLLENLAMSTPEAAHTFIKIMFGTCQGIRHQRDKICWVCKTNHDQQLNDAINHAEGGSK